MASVPLSYFKHKKTGETDSSLDPPFIICLIITFLLMQKIRGTKTDSRQTLLTNVPKDKVTEYDHASFIAHENKLNMYLNTAKECNLPFEYNLLHRCKEYKHSVLLVTEEVPEDHCFDLRSFL